MGLILVPVLLVLLAMVVISLGRGIAAFLKTTREDLEHGEGSDTGPSPMQLQQNRMMFARIKYQMAAIAVLALIMMAAGGHKG